MKNKVIRIATDSDTELTIQIANTRITDENGTRDGGKELAILLAQNVGLESDGELVATLTASQTDELIKQLSTLREQL